MPTVHHVYPALRRLPLTIAACAALGDSATDPGPPAPPPPTGELLISAATPIAPSRATAANGAELSAALRDSKRAIPAASLVHLFF